MSEKTASGLIAYCKAQLGRPYWMGTFGQIASAGIYQSNKKRLPQYYAAADFPRQYGQRVHDCIGLVKGYLWSDGPNAAPRYLSEPLRVDLDADGMYYKCSPHGGIGSMPDKPGTLVFIFSGKKMEHIGVYIGGGQVIEARGHAYGVVQTALRGRGWTHWGLCPYITYDSAESAGSEDDMISQEQFNSMFVTAMQSYRSKLQDNDAEAWSEKARAWAQDTGLVAGGDPLPNGQKNFMWEDTLTREQMVVLLYRFAKMVGKA